MRGRNLKKVLSLVLCMAMMLSVMVVGAGAAFKDQEKIVNDEAVDMCVALKIINGYTDGSYRPEGTITRAEAAKMICIALNGGKEPVLSASATSAFADINGHWAAKYIEYCVSKGIVAGKSATQFDPNGNVTGTELAKMLLIAIGYNAENEKFVGANWDTNVNVVASQKDLYKDLETIDPAVALSRDNAAQMIWNALNAVLVEYEYTLVSDNGTLTSQVVVKDVDPEETLMEDKYSADTTTTGIMTAYEWNDDDEVFVYSVQPVKADGTLDTAVKYETATDYTGLYAMNVSVVCKVDSKNAIVNDEVFGMFAEDSVILYEGVVSDLEGYDADYVKVDGTKYKVDLATGESISKTDISVIEQYAENDYANAGKTTAAAPNAMKVIDLDGDGKIDCIVYLPTVTAKVTYVGTKDITLSSNAYNITKATFEDDVIYDGVAKDDYVAVVKAANTAYDGNVVVKLDSVSGDVTAVKSGKIMMNDTWYTLALNTQSKVSSFDLNDEYTLYISGTYVLFAEEGENNLTLDELAYVKATTAGDAVDAGKAKVYFADGTSATVTLTDSYFLADGTEVTVDATGATKDYSALDGKLCTFEKDGNDYELTLVGTGNDLGYTYASGNYGITAKDDDKAGKIGDVSVADDAVVFITETDGDINVVTGETAKSYKSNVAGLTGGVMLTDEVNGVNAIQVALVNANVAKLPNATGETELYAYVLDTPYQVKDGDDYYAQYTIWNGKEEVVVREELATKNDATQAYEGAIIEYTNLGNNEVEDVIEVAVSGTNNVAAKVAVKGTSGNEVYMTSGSSLTSSVSGEQASACWYITKDTVILYVDSEDMGGFADGTIQNAREEAVAGGYKLVENAYLYGSTNDHEIVLLVVETSNEWH